MNNGSYHYKVTVTMCVILDIPQIPLLVKVEECVSPTLQLAGAEPLSLGKHFICYIAP